MKVIELYNKLCEIIPSSLSCDWDRDGLEACPEPCREIKRVLVALDITGYVIDKAIKEKFDVIIAHHPLFFGGLSSINSLNADGKRAVLLAKNDIAVMTFHTRLDAVSGGVNDVLASRLGLSDVEAVDSGSDTIMRLGNLEGEMSPEEFARLVKSTLSDGGQEASIVLSSADRKVKKVAVLGGSGGDYIALAAQKGADTFVTGDMKYHQELSALDFNINLISAGHFFTEYPVCEFLRDLTEKLCPDVQVEICFSNKIEVV